MLFPFAPMLIWDGLPLLFRISVPPLMTKEFVPFESPKFRMPKVTVEPGMAASMVTVRVPLMSLVKLAISPAAFGMMPPDQLPAALQFPFALTFQVPVVCASTRDGDTAKLAPTRSAKRRRLRARETLNFGEVDRMDSIYFSELATLREIGTWHGTTRRSAPQPRAHIPCPHSQEGIRTCLIRRA